MMRTWSTATRRRLLPRSASSKVLTSYEKPSAKMKSLKLIAAGMLAASSMVYSFADTIYITGSSAYRAATHDAIKALFKNDAAFGYGYSGTDITAAKYGIFKGHLVS